jgi:hypothetical protein
MSKLSWAMIIIYLVVIAAFVADVYLTMDDRCPLTVAIADAPLLAGGSNCGQSHQ